ncbi:trypsin-like peptidase domain-containing protein [Methylocaldum gracile subsp. desertum]|uniref:trypsin-like peptidase domain-containing protein n=1 Tax=Methylocaldum sp. GT1BW TaxID=3438964 RepID=UPI003DA1B7B6
MPFRISQPSFQSLYIEMQVLGNTIASGSSFVVIGAAGMPFLITNRHNVTGRNQDSGELLSTTGAIPDTLVISHNSKSGLGEFVKVKEPLYNGDTPRWIEHPTLGAKADVVALPVSESDGVALYPYKTRYETHLDIEPAQMVSVVGFPFGMRTGPSFAVWATGFVASEPEINHNGLPVFLIDCRTRKGQSGSPVILYRNGGGIITHENSTSVISPVCQLLGIYSGRINPESDLGIVWKSYVIAELIDYANTTCSP